MKVYLLLAFVVAPGLAALALAAPAAEAPVKVTADQAPVEQWPAMAAAGDPLAQALLARAFFHGTDGKAENLKDAAEWARRSAAQNHPLGMFLGGYCQYYDFTQPRARREEDAKPFFEQAIAAGFEKLAEQGGRQWLTMLWGIARPPTRGMTTQ